MCKLDTKIAADAVADHAAQQKKSTNRLKATIAILAVTTLAFMISTIVLATDNKKESNTQSSGIAAVVPTTQTEDKTNPCEGKKPAFDNVQCIIDSLEQTGEQSGVNVTKGYQGDRDVDTVPITLPYWQAGLCPVNVHWHLGAEHYSVGEYDELGTGPDNHLADKTREGFQCRFYDETDPKFTTEYKWEHCKDMVVGQTYEVHWPHSSAGACRTPWQYQTPFYDGVFCTDGVISLETTASQIGVQSQVFTIVNDEQYYYADLFDGMIIDGIKGMDVAKYTGSTTGTSRNNEICSPFTPITWQVDRKCHMISASSFDKMCMEMKAQADNMEDDLHPHGSRELVADEHAADNHQLLRSRFLLRRN